MSQFCRVSRGLRGIPSALSQQSLSRGAPRLYSQLTCHLPRPSPTHLANKARIALPTFNIRYNSSKSDPQSPKPLTDRVESADKDADAAEQNRLRREQEPAYQLTFTCKPCGGRSSHRVSKHGYHRGTVLIQCPGCTNRHVISDHLNIFFDQKKTLDDLLQERGQTITRGELKGDMEFWEDGTVNQLGGGQ
ncbi:DNL zinc finger-domain-containing protein [Aspergillus unguis]